MRWLRWSGLPREVRAALRLEHGERVIAYALTRGDEYVVATDRALHLPGGTRVGWERVEHAAWKDGWLHVRETLLLGEEPREYHVRLTEPGVMPEALRERVTASIVLSRHLRHRSGRGVRVVARRRPGSNELTWTLVFDAGADPRDPELRGWAERMLEEVRRQTVA